MVVRRLPLHATHHFVTALRRHSAHNRYTPTARPVAPFDTFSRRELPTWKRRFKPEDSGRADAWRLKLPYLFVARLPKMREAQRRAAGLTKKKAGGLFLCGWS